jgi:SAM-dependent methyltransferase
MTSSAATPLAERLLQLFQHLGIERAHIAARNVADWHGFATAHPDRMASLSLICPAALDVRPFPELVARMLVISGDRGAAAERLQAAAANTVGMASTTLHHCEALMWSDLAADRGTEVGSAMLGFLRSMEERHRLAPVRLAEGEGEAAGISYRVRGAGPPLVLMPLELAPSQWKPLVPLFAERYCTIELGGAFLGIVALLEARGRSDYLAMIRTLLDHAQLQPGATVLDVGCGSGVAIREVARRSRQGNRLIAIDTSPYLLGETEQLARQEGFGGMVEVREGRAEALPFADNTMDLTLSCTVLEEGDADRMLAEMIRVTKLGGRVAVIVRAVDVPAWVNLPLGAQMRSKVSVPGLFGAGVAPGGCADASLYSRFSKAGLAQLRCFAQFNTITPEEPRLRMLQQQPLATFSSDEASQWQRAIEQAEAEGTPFNAQPHHCAIGTKS